MHIIPITPCFTFMKKKKKKPEKPSKIKEKGSTQPKEKKKSRIKNYSPVQVKGKEKKKRFNVPHKSQLDEPDTVKICTKERTLGE